MASTTFSGPIKAGTISNTTGTTIGTNIANVGQVVMSQTFAAIYQVEQLQLRYKTLYSCKFTNH